MRKILIFLVGLLLATPVLADTRVSSLARKLDQTSLTIIDKDGDPIITIQSGGFVFSFSVHFKDGKPTKCWVGLDQSGILGFAVFDDNCDDVADEAWIRVNDVLRGPIVPADVHKLFYYKWLGLMEELMIDAVENHPRKEI